MHMADALISPVVAGTFYAATGVAAGVSIKKLTEEGNRRTIPTMGVMGAFVFASQMINFTIPGTGSSGHLCGGLLLSAVLGPYAGFLSMIGVLLVQCLFFADGGLMALGCNVWNMAFYGCLMGATLIWRPILRAASRSDKGRGRVRAGIILASVLGGILPLQLGAFSVVLQTYASGITELPFGAFVAAMQPIHLAIGLVEGLISAAVLCFIYEVRPELIWGLSDADTVSQEKSSSKWSTGKVVLVMAALTLVIGTGLSLFASAFPDGLEWSIERVSGLEELEAAGGLYDVAGRIQEATSFLPDYAFKGSESGTSVSGLVGAIIVAMVCAAFAFTLGRIRKNKGLAEQS